jgi:hypothetical protein
MHSLSSHHASGLVPTSSAKTFFQETFSEYHTLEAHQDEYRPQEPQGTEGFRVQERAAEQAATHHVHLHNGSGSGNHQVSAGKPHD